MLDRVPIITLITDFGLKDGNVGVMKGVIWGIAPQAQIADLSHLVGPQDIQEAALILLRSAPYFPDGTIHVVVVDPGVGTLRRPIAAQVGGQYFVGPDNGVIGNWLAWAETGGMPTRFVHLDRPQYWRPEISHVFHGRDVFAPVAGHLAAGVPLDALGAPVDNPVRLPPRLPVRTPHGWQAEIIHIDHFGNLSTSLRLEQLGQPDHMTLRLAGVSIHGMARTFGERPPGELIALYGSTGNLIIAVVNGNACQRLQAKVGDPVEVIVEA
jgi:hypothetical protein